MHRRRFLATAAAATTGIVGVSSQVTKASVPDSRYTTESVCLRYNPAGGSKGLITPETGGYVVDGPVSSGDSTWWKLSFNEDGEENYTHCLSGTDGTATGWVESEVLASAGFAYPVDGMVYREWQESVHRELDILADAGQSVYAASDGTVVTAESGEESWCGRHVVVDHGAGWKTKYCHLQDVLVSEGQPVTKGFEIGTVGSTGEASRSHVAFSVRQDGIFWAIPGVKGRQLLAGAGVPGDYR